MNKPVLTPSTTSRPAVGVLSAIALVDLLVNFVDLYDLVLFGIVRVQRLHELDIADAAEVTN